MDGTWNIELDVRFPFVLFDHASFFSGGYWLLLQFLKSTSVNLQIYLFSIFDYLNCSYVGI